jgi:hypothetical protein
VLVKARLMDRTTKTIAALLLFTVSACAQGPTTSRSISGVSGSDAVSKWAGEYDPFSRACIADALIMHASKFSWGDCKEAKIRVIAASDTELLFEVDPKAKCGWAGWIVGLTRPSTASRAVSVNAYRNIQDHQAGGHQVFCAYSKK